MRSFWSLSVLSAQVSRQAALGKMEPPRPEWASRTAVFTDSSVKQIPRIPSDCVGRPSKSTLPNSQMQASAASFSWCCSTKPGMLGLPTSSSPSMINLTLHGSSPNTSRTAASAASRAMMWPLSSLTPRAYTLLPRCVSSNGGDSHSSSGSGGCTS